MEPIETIRAFEEQKAQDAMNEQLDTLDKRVVDEFIRDIREAQQDGYGFISIDKLKRALMAIAGLQGLQNVLNIEDVISELVENVNSNESNMVITNNLDEARELLKASSDVLTQVPGQRSLAQQALRVAQNLDASGFTEATNTANDKA